MTKSRKSEFVKFTLSTSGHVFGFGKEEKNAAPLQSLRGLPRLVTVAKLLLGSHCSGEGFCKQSTELHQLRQEKINSDPSHYS